jgi:hypothetical protein
MRGNNKRKQSVEEWQHEKKHRGTGDDKIDRRNPLAVMVALL